MTSREQIDKLAKFIMEEVDDEPSQDEGAVDTAIRIIREQNRKLRIMKNVLGDEDYDILCNTVNK